ncbi:hypothetical protein [Ruficoccus sp. ZRK36]|uniref:hypothetical protein n=1 Tax=Ruficoccus sp. ZRK36 TaxID=2866311 RepID=UPI001C735567|nr:hypothetical protein [Ruficoccus sp. ZRK36]QYY35246.1 hypothetical protein K0V07_13200 [Ruficoccus sp. ZRK36]
MLSLISAVCCSLLLAIGNLYAEDSRAELQEALSELDALYADVLPWMAQLYDPDSGGFYESIGLKERKEPKDYGPDIQSTFFAIVILANSDMVETMPPAIKRQMVRYFQSRQDPQTGYFVDHDYPDMVENQRVLGRALSFSLGSLRMLGSEPLYPLPGQPRRPSSRRPEKSAPAPAKDTRAETLPSPARVDTRSPPSAPAQGEHPNVYYVPAAQNVYRVPSAEDLSRLDTSSFPPHLASVEAFRAWLDERPWEHSWTALDNLSSQYKLINTLPQSYRDVIIDEAMRNVEARQDPETGLIGGGDLQVRISGAFKFVSFCSNVGRPIPRAAQIQQTLLEWFADEPEIDRIFFIRNACDMMDKLCRSTGRKLTNEELIQVTRFAVSQLKRFRQADGGFRSFTFGSFVSPNDLYLGRNSIPAQAGDQSEMNGTSNAYRVWKAIYWLAGQERPRDSMEGFWEVSLSESQPEKRDGANAADD